VSGPPSKPRESPSVFALLRFLGDVALRAAPESMLMLGMLWASVALLDPARRWGGFLGPLLALGGAALRSKRGEPAGRWLLVLALAMAVGTASFTEPEFRADAVEYFALLRSIAIDRDINIGNEWQKLTGEERVVGPTGLPIYYHSVGASLVWLPFYMVAHLYVQVSPLLGGFVYKVNGYSTPYIRATCLGTVSVATTGAWLLYLMLARRVERSCAALAVIGTLAASPMLYYVFVNSSMSHGLTYGLAAMCLWAVERSERLPSMRCWTLAGLLLGLAVLVRAQALALALLPLTIGCRQLAQRRVRWVWLASGAAASLVVFAPQMLLWKAIFDQWVWFASGYGLTRGLATDWSSPRLLDVLLSSYRGFFQWTPGMALALAGFVPAFRKWGTLCLGCLLVFAATAWFNGCHAGDWFGSDSFGSRRFDLVVPLLVLGAAALIESLLRRPLWCVAGGLAMLGLWNVGLMRLHRSARIVDAAPLETTAALQGAQLREIITHAMGRVAGDYGREIAYKFFVGEYLYVNINPSGTIDLGNPDDARHLGGGWSQAVNGTGPPTFRWAALPRACVRFALLDVPSADFPALITARAPGRLGTQDMRVELNGKGLASVTLQRELSTTRVSLSPALLAGENVLCLAFDRSARGDPSRAAAVSQIQLP
jgi:hypothetical protein